MKVQMKHLAVNSVENSLAVHWLGLRALTAGGLGSIPGWGTKIEAPPQKAVNRVLLTSYIYF